VKRKKIKLRDGLAKIIILVLYVTPSYSIVEYTIKARIKRYNPRAVAYIFMEASVQRALIPYSIGETYIVVEHHALPILHNVKILFLSNLGYAVYSVLWGNQPFHL
jgi:hypothetical protein